MLSQAIHTNDVHHTINEYLIGLDAAKHQKLITLINQTYYSHPDYVNVKSEYFPFAFPIIQNIVNRLAVEEINNDIIISMINEYFGKRVKYIFKHLDKINAERAALDEICDEMYEKLRTKS